MINLCGGATYWLLAFDACAIAVGSDLESSALITATLKDLGACFIAAKALTERQVEILKNRRRPYRISRKGNEKGIGKRAAHQPLLPGRISTYLELDPNWSLKNLKRQNGCPTSP